MHEEEGKKGNHSKPQQRRLPSRAFLPSYLPPSLPFHTVPFHQHLSPYELIGGIPADILRTYCRLALDGRRRPSAPCIQLQGPPRCRYIRVPKPD